VLVVVTELNTKNLSYTPSKWSEIYFSRVLAWLVIGAVAGIGTSRAEEDLVQVREDFSSDPGWDNWNNRVEFHDCPTVTQNFGWRATSHFGGEPGEIGGTIWRSTTPAWYAMPLGHPLSFKDSFSASGRVVVMPPRASGLYIGFFNAERPGWRTWSSLALRFMHSEQGDCMVDYKTGQGKSNLCDPGAVIPPDGKPHTWSLSYDPEGVPNLIWPDTKMTNWLSGDAYRMETNVLELARKDYPEMTSERLRRLLGEAFNRGLVDKHMLKGKYPRWVIQSTEGRKGRIRFSVDGQAYSAYMLPGHQGEPTQINRFGIFNEQMFSDSSEVYFSDLIINGHGVSLKNDPLWEGRGNHVTFVDPEYRERMDFGFSESNWAGKAPGELGGKLWSTEPENPFHGYYADEIGKLSLEDEFSFSGNVCFVDGGPDGLSFLGYFNRAEKVKPIEGERNGHPLGQSMGIVVHDYTPVGYYFESLCAPTHELAQTGGGPVFVPDRVRRKFKFHYDPHAGSAGRISVTLDNEKFTQDLSPDMRRQGAVFDHFGLMNVRIGGKYQVIYFDDLEYTARRSTSYKPKKHPQKTTSAP